MIPVLEITIHEASSGRLEPAVSPIRTLRIPPGPLKYFIDTDTVIIGPVARAPRDAGHGDDHPRAPPAALPRPAASPSRDSLPADGSAISPEISPPEGLR
ncbi:hypothetical protein GCM10022252_01940 [Streptosporangium oxazolinicum]|uniref:Uncharacterized protein n=1 Tax=Streptosporangium oxazolinicum TaxID=909287 RepID=A0ABP8A8L6_9ACTN